MTLRQLLSLVPGIISILLLSGCGDKLGSDSEIPVIRRPYVRPEEVLNDFSLLNQDGQAAPPKDPASRAWPFGVLLGFHPGGTISFCTVSHLAGDLVVTNAHCFTNDAAPGDYYIVFYDKAGQKKYRQVSEAIYKGVATRDDVTILALQPGSGDEWHTVGSQVRDTSGTIGGEHPVAVEVTLWTFDPLTAHPGLTESHGQLGMIFQMKQCLSSRTTPLAFGLTSEPAPLGTRNPIKFDRADPKLHAFIDTCDLPLMHGNSGSLITTRNKLNEKIGVFHWSVGPTEQVRAKYRHYEYRGNQDKVVDYPQGPPDNMFYGVGTVFDWLLKQSPGI